jgi:hypothetical protein
MAEVANNVEMELAPELERITMMTANLEQQLLVSDPEIRTYMRDIHTALLHQPELVHILQDEQRAVIMDGLMQVTGEEFSKQSEVKEKATRSKQLKQQTIDDI